MSLINASVQDEGFKSYCQAFHPVEGQDSVTLLSLMVPPPVKTDQPKETTVQKEAFFNICLDVSGSMAGSGINCAKMAMKRLIDHLIKTCGVPAKRVIVYLYNDSCTPRVMGQANDEQWLQSIRAGGGTRFASVFDQVVLSTESVIRNENLGNTEVDVSLFFFTDGQDGYPKQLDHSKVGLERLLKSDFIESTVHTFGFTSSHDAKLLSWLTSLGSNNGCFQYIQESSAIEESMSTALALLGDSVMKKQRKIDIFTGMDIDAATPDDWTAVKLESDGVSGSAVLRQKPFTNELVYWREHVGQQEESDTTVDKTKKLEVQWLEDSNIHRTIRMTTFIQHELLRLVEAINAVGSSKADPAQKQKELLKIDEETETYSKALGIMASESFRKKDKEEREASMDACQKTRSLLQSFLALKADAHKQGGSISNTSLATFNSLAYGQVNEAKLKAKLDARAGKNTALFSDLDAKVTKIVDGLNFDAMEAAESQNNLKELTCAISTNNYIDALRDGDCLCMALDVSRGAGAIADPSQLVIKSIFPTFLTSTMFTSALRYSLSENNPESVHGGFDKNINASIVPGVANENITAVLPLYINENHWKVANLRMKPIMGYVVTLDATGYTYSQSTTVPFLVLIKALESHPMTEFKQRQIKLILETCDAIYLASRDLRQNTKTMVEQFCASHLQRTADVITNIYVFLGHVICALRAGDIKADEMSLLLPKFEVVAIEEQIRRDMSWKVSESLVGSILNWLNVDKKRDIVDPGLVYQEQHDAYIKGLGSESGSSMDAVYRSIYDSVRVEQGLKPSSRASKPASVSIAAVESKVATVTKPEFKIPDFDPVDWELTVASLDRLGSIQNAIAVGVDKIRRLMAVIRSPLNNDLPHVLTSQLGAKAVPEFAHEFYSRYSPKITLATLLQAYAHTKNSDRRGVQNLMTPFERESSTGPDKSSDEALQYMKSLYEAKMSQMINVIVNDVEERYLASKNNESAAVFTFTNDLDVAAGVLADAKFRGGEGGRLVSTCAVSKMSLPREKIQMLLSGKYKGVRLFQDKAENDVDILRWAPCKKTLYRMFQNYHDVFTYSEWCKVHPDSYDRYFAKRYIIDGHLSELSKEEQALVESTN